MTAYNPAPGGEQDGAEFEVKTDDGAEFEAPSLLQRIALQGFQGDGRALALRDPFEKPRAEIPGDMDGCAPEAVAAGRKYLELNCVGPGRFIKPDDHKTVDTHITELYKIGVSREWAMRAMTAMCFAWDEDPRSFIARTTRTRYEQYDQLGLSPANRADRFKAMRWDELKNVSDPTYLWDGYIAHNTFALFYGAPKAGKTFMALGLSLSVVNGLPFCGRDTQKGPVLYVIAEGGKGEIKKRINAWIRETVLQHFPADEDMSDKTRKHLQEIRAAYTAELESNIQRSFHIVPTPVMMNEPSDVLTLVASNPAVAERPHDKTLDHSGLIVIDTLMRCTSGNPSDAESMMAFVNGCDTLRTETGCAVLVVHHEGKDAARGATGSIHLTGAPDFVASLIRKRGTPERMLQVYAMRNGNDEQDDLVYRLPTVNLGMDEKGKDVTSCCVEYVEHRPHGAKPKTLDEVSPDDQGFVVLEAIDRDKPKTIKALAESFANSKSQATVYRTVAELREAGYLPEKGLTVTNKGRAYLETMSEGGEGDDADDMDEFG